MRVQSLALLALLSFAVGEKDHDHDDHDGHSLEYMSVYDLSNDTSYVLTVDKVDGQYADPSMVFSFHPCASLDMECIESNEEKIEELWKNGEAENVSTSDKVLVKENELYQIKFNENFLTSYIFPEIVNSGPHVMVFEHGPKEISLSVKDFKGNSIEVEAYEAHGHEDDEEPSDNAILLTLAATGITSACALLGIFILIPVFKNAIMKPGNFEKFQMYSSAFAGGTLMGASGFIMLPEAMHSIQDGGFDSAAMVNFVLGLSLFIGFMIGAIIHYAAQLLVGSNEEENIEKRLSLVDMNMKADEMDEDNLEEERRTLGICDVKKWKPVVWSVLIGDAFHNIGDGIAIGTAFRNCNSALGWVVFIGALAHELPTELGDFLVLTGPGKIKISTALFLNLLSGMTCVFGGIAAALLPLTGSWVGGILAVSVGTYIWVITEVFPYVVKAKSKLDISVCLTLFLFGAGCISLVLIRHEHCGGHGH